MGDLEDDGEMHASLLVLLTVRPTPNTCLRLNRGKAKNICINSDFNDPGMVKLNTSRRERDETGSLGWKLGSVLALLASERDERMSLENLS